MPPYLTVTSFPKRSNTLVDLKNVKSVETLMQGATEFGALYAQNATNERTRVCNNNITSRA